MGVFLFWGFHAFLLGAFLHIIGLAFFIFSEIFPAFSIILPKSVYYASNFFFILFAASILIEIILSALSGQKKKIVHDDWRPKNLVVVMTAYNDEESVGSAVKNFRKHKSVKKVIVVDNNSEDNTFAEAKKAGATVFREKKQGYGYCCRRALFEGRQTGADAICLVESDMTFDSADLDKMLPYLAHADMVLGTRTTRELQDSGTQMNIFINYGNQFISKLIQLKFWGVRLTDVGCTYRVIKSEAYDKIRQKLRVGRNEFSPDMIIASLQEGLKVIEVPVTFRKRIGVSKGVGSRYIRGFIVGVKMWLMVATARIIPRKRR